MSCLNFYRLPKSACDKANSLYGGPGSEHETPCDGTKHPDICSFKKKRDGNGYNVECNSSVCGSSGVQVSK